MMTTHFLNAQLREPVPFREDKLPWHEWLLTLRAAVKTKPTRYPAQPLPLPVAHTDAPIAGALELARWRHDFPPPQNIVARQLAKRSLRQANDGHKESFRWFPDEEKWERLEPHDTDWLQFYFLLGHDVRRAGAWQHVTPQVSLGNLFHVRYPMAAPKAIWVSHSIPVSISSRDLSDLRADVPTYWGEPIRAFTVRYVDGDGALRKVRHKPEPSKFSLTYHNPKFSLNPDYEPERSATPICDDRKHYFSKVRMQQAGVQCVRDNVLLELVEDALGGARFKPMEAPLEYLQSFTERVEDFPLHANAPDPRGLHETDKWKFAQHAVELEQARREYEQDEGVEQDSGELTKEQKKALKRKWNGRLKEHGLRGHELSGLKYRPFKQSTTGTNEPDRNELEEAVRDSVGADVSIINHDDSDYLRRLATQGEVFREYYGDNPTKVSPELKRDLHLYETALSKEWKSDAERKEWQRRLDTMHYFIHGVCPTGTCGVNNRCANPDLSPEERQLTHATNLLQKVSPKEFAKLKVGTYYLVVVLQGQPRLKVLKAKTEDAANEETQRLIETAVKRARTLARRQGKSEKDAERRIRDAYRVAYRHYLADEKYPQSQQRDAAD